MPDWSIWLIVAVLFAGGELVIFTGFILGPFAVAAAITAVVAAFDTTTELQLAVFGILSLVMMLALRPIARKHLEAPPEIRTNADALIGKEARVLEPITHDQPGLIRLVNENWSASPVQGVPRIDPEQYVTVVEIAGATAIVEPKEAPQETPRETPQGASQ
jgi:membrane protein implicated in regulation of membrane protease activity